MNELGNPIAKSLLGVFAALVLVWLIAPMVVIFPISFAGEASFQFPPRSWSLRWYEAFFHGDEWMNALRNSFLIAIMVAALALTLGTVAAIAMFRARNKLAKSVQALLLTPMIVPPIIAGAGVYIFFLKTGLVGTFFGFVMVHTTLALPFVVIAIGASLATYDTTYERAAASLGAGRLRTFTSVTMPLLAPGMLAGAVFAFVTSFDEIIIAQFMVSPSLETLPMMMYTSVMRTTDPTIASAAALVLSVTLIVFVFYQLVIAPARRRKITVSR